MFLIQKYSPKVEGEICKCPKGEIKKEKAKRKKGKERERGLKRKKMKKYFTTEFILCLKSKSITRFFLLQKP